MPFEATMDLGINYVETDSMQLHKNFSSHLCASEAIRRPDKVADRRCYHCTRCSNSEVSIRVSQPEKFTYYFCCLL